MNDYVNIYYNDHLMHHGVKGMKWGVRKMEEKGGSYTKKGLSKFKSALDEYEQGKKAYKLSKSISDPNVNINRKALRKELRNQKRELNKSYKSLKNDYKADQGKELYKNGVTIGQIKTKQNLTSLGTTAITHVASSALEQSGHQAAANILRAADFAAWVGYSAKNMRDANRLRAYYAH